MVWKNFTRQLAITSRRKVLATALLYGISATVRFTSPAGEDTGRPTHATQKADLMTSVTTRDGVQIFYATDVVERPHRRNAIHAGHSTGGGQAVRPVARLHTRFGRARVAKLVLIGALLPLMLKTTASPGNWPIEVFDGLHKERTSSMRTTQADAINADSLSFVTT